MSGVDSQFPALQSATDSAGRSASEFSALFLAFIEALSDPDGGATFFDFHSAEAALRTAAGIAPAATLAREAFASRHRDLNLSGQGRLPCFTEPVHLQSTNSDDPQGAVSWFAVRETVQDQPLFVALGTRKSLGKTQIVWCTAADRVTSWTFREGWLQSLADYAWMRRTEPASPRALLDASYFRRYLQRPVRFQYLPEARFGCQMSGACCRHDYEITLPPEAQLLIDTLPWESIDPTLKGTRLSPRADGMLQLKSLDETCRFLAPGNQCLIHRTLGRQPFGPCCVFPFSFSQTPDGIAVAASPICGSVRQGLGARLEDRHEDLQERLAHVTPKSTDTYRLAPGVVITWEQFRDVEKALCDCLSAGDLPLRRRLYAGSRLLGALKEGQRIDLSAWLAEPALSITSDLREAIRGMLARLIGWDRATLRALPREIPHELSQQEMRETKVLEQILRNSLFSKVYSYPFDLTTAHNHLIVLYLLALTMQAAATPLTEEMWRELGSLGVHGLLKVILHEGMPEGFRALLGTPEFGLWMLAA